MTFVMFVSYMHGMSVMLVSHTHDTSVSCTHDIRHVGQLHACHVSHACQSHT